MNFDAVEADFDEVVEANLDTSQRAMLAVRSLPVFEADARGRQRAAGGDRKSDDARSLPANLPEAIEDEADDEPAPPPFDRHAREARSEAAAAFSVSPRAVQSAKAVSERGVPELVEAVVEVSFDEVNFDHAVEGNNAVKPSVAAAEGNGAL